jgi:hypothetical protein
MRKPGEAAWDYVGKFTAPESEISTLRAPLLPLRLLRPSIDVSQQTS